jgi:hypothetical protein
MPGRSVATPSHASSAAAASGLPLVMAGRLRDFFPPESRATLPQPSNPEDEGCRVVLSPEEQRTRQWSQPHPRPSSSNDTASPAFCCAISRFLSSGVCWFENALPPELVQECRRSAVRRLNHLRGELSEQKRAMISSSCSGCAAAEVSEHRSIALMRCDFAELTERDGGRVDMRYRMDEPPFSNPTIVSERWHRTLHHSSIPPSSFLPPHSSLSQQQRRQARRQARS